MYRDSSGGCSGLAVLGAGIFAAGIFGASCFQVARICFCEEPGRAVRVGTGTPRLLPGSPTGERVACCREATHKLIAPRLPPGPALSRYHAECLRGLNLPTDTGLAQGGGSRGQGASKAGSPLLGAVLSKQRAALGALWPLAGHFPSLGLSFISDPLLQNCFEDSGKL